MIGYGQYRYTLLVTVSAAALMLTVERGPQAADLVAPVSQDQWWFSAEGQYLMYEGDKARYSLDGAEGFGDVFGRRNFSAKLKPEDGWGIGGEVGFRPADSAWSYVGRVRYGQSNKEKKKTHFYTYHSRFDFSRYNGEADQREEHIIADLEIGRDVGLGAFGDGSNLRLFAGVRFAHFKGDGSISSNNIAFSGPYVSGHADVDRTFTGIGPRIGFDATMPLSPQFALDMGAAGSLLYGKQKFKASGTAFEQTSMFTDINETRSKMTWVPNLEASAALSWLVSDNAKFSLGYRVDSYFDVYDDGELYGSRDEGDRIIHGPFVKLTVGGGG